MRATRILLSVIFAILIFRSFVFGGLYPFPAQFLRAWYEPYKSDTGSGGSITLAHKPVVDDAFRIIFPARMLSLREIGEGRLPLWNPYQGAGTPLLAMMHPGLANPFGLLFQIFPANIAWTVFVALQAAVLSMGMLLFSASIGLTAVPAIFSTTVLLISGYVTVRLEYGEFLYGYAVLPLLLWAIGTGKSGMVIALLTGFLLLTGQPQVIIYVLGSALIYGIVIGLSGRAYLKKLLLPVLVGSGMAAFQLFPALELYLQSAIRDSGSSLSTSGWFVPLPHLITVLIPNYFGSTATYNYFGFGADSVETAAWVGTVGVYFAVIALFQRNPKYARTVRYFMLMSLFSVVMAVDWPISRMLHALPIPVLSRESAVRIFALSTFGLSALAGIGLATYIRQAGKTGKATVLFITGLLLLGGWTVFAWYSHLSCPVIQVADCRSVSLRNYILESGIFGLTLVMIRLLARRPVVAGYIVIVLLWISGLYNSHKFLPFTDNTEFIPHTAMTAALRREAGLNRFFGIGEAQIKPNLSTALGLYDIQYYDPLRIKRYGQLLEYANSGKLQPVISRSDALVINDATPSAAVNSRRNRLFDILSVTHLIYPNSQLTAASSGKIIWRDGNFSLQQRFALPRAYPVTGFEVIGDDEALLARLFDPGFDPAKSVLLDQVPDMPATYPDATASAVITDYRPNRVTVRVVAGSPVLTVLTDSYYPGWEARVDGVRTPVYRANFALRAVPVPAGDHILELRYLPSSFKWGIIVTAGSLLAGLILRLWRIF